MIRRTALALLLPVLVAAAPAPRPEASGSVRTLRLEPREGRTELTVEIAGGEVRWTHFPLSGPARVVVDIAGARSDLPTGSRTSVNRGGVREVRTSQYLPDVVRVVLVLDRAADYVVERVPEGVRVSMPSPAGEFQPWSTGRTAGGAAPPAAAPAAPEPRLDGAYRAAADAPSRAFGSAPSAQTPPQQQRRQGRPITVSFEGTPMLDVLASFAEVSNRSIIAGQGIGQIPVYATITNQPWDVALANLLNAYNLAAQEDASGIIRVDKIENLAQRVQQDPLRTQTFRINYVTVAEMDSTLRPLLSERGSLTRNTTANTLIVTDVVGVVESFGQLIKELDIRTPQVAIQAKIIFINRTDAEELGVTYDLKDSRGSSLNQLVSVPDPLNPGEVTNQDLISLGGNSIAALGNANSRVQGASLETVISLVLGRFTLISFLDALQTAELSDVQAAPVVTTTNNHEAQIWVGEETPIRVVDLGTGSGGGGGGTDGAAAAGQPRATAQLVETGIRLRVTPQVTADRHVLLTLHAERSSAQLAATEIGVNFQRQLGETRLMVKDGETAVIGGLTVTEVTSTRSGIPVLMDLPFIGALFRKTTDREQKRDLLIMVTPHIVEERP